MIWPNTISNAELWNMADIEPIDVTIRRMKWIGHTLRKNDSSVAKKVLRWNPPAASNPSRGRPRTTWRNTVEKEAKSINKVWRELGLIAVNRVRWRTGVVDALCPPREQRR